MSFENGKASELERKKGAGFLVGALLALGAVLAAFEWTEYRGVHRSFGDKEIVLEEEELMPITLQTPPPPPPPVPQPTLIEIVNDELEVEVDPEILESESEEFQEVQLVYMEDEVVDEMHVFDIVEQNAEFPGGVEALFKYLQSKVHYPTIAQESRIAGTVFVEFLIEKDGSVNQDSVKVIRGVHAALDAEAVRVVRDMPNWLPARQRGKAVRQNFKLPFRFTLT